MRTREFSNALERVEYQFIAENGYKTIRRSASFLPQAYVEQFFQLL